MKLKQSNQSFSVEGGLNSTDFGIGNPALILEYLRNHIYKEPIKALTREYISNARDAHREVGKGDVPIEVTLPDIWNPIWSVRDFGPGISPDRMENIFTQFGNSTKRETNEQTGAFGLGCKSGFAYSDNFNVITIFNGIKYFYSAILDGKKGKMVLLSSEETDEPSGTTISISVAGKDFRDFEAFTIFATIFWDIKPVIHNLNRKFPNLEKTFSGDSFFISDTFFNYFYSINHSLAIIDGIPYPIDPYLFEGRISTSLKCNLHLIFNTGDLDLSPSRDNLRYTNETKDLIIKRVQQVKEYITNVIYKDVCSAPTYKEAALSWSKMGVNLPINIKLLLDTPYWNGSKVKTSFISNDIGIWTQVYKFRLKKSCHSLSYTKTDGNIEPFDKNKIYVVQYTDSPIPRSRIQSFLKENNNINYFAVIKCLKHPNNPEFLKKYNSSSDPNPEAKYDYDLIKRLDIPSLEEFNCKLPKIERVRHTTKLEEGNINAYSLFENSIGKISLRREEIPNTGGFYIIIDYNKKKFKINNKIIERYSFIKAAQNILETKVYGFTKKRSKNLTSSWIPLEVAIQNKLNDLFKQYSFKEIVYASKFRDFHWNRNISILIDYININKINSPESYFTKYYKKSIETSKLEKIYSLYYLIFEVYDINMNINDNDNDNDLKKYYNEFITRYPLILCISDYRMINHMYEYVNLVDGKYESKSIKLAV